MSRWPASTPPPPGPAGAWPRSTSGASTGKRPSPGWAPRPASALTAPPWPNCSGCGPPRTAPVWRSRRPVSASTCNERPADPSADGGRNGVGVLLLPGLAAIGGSHDGVDGRRAALRSEYPADLGREEADGRGAEQTLDGPGGA